MTKPIDRTTFKGVIAEPLPSGQTRLRVRVKGDPKLRIAIPSGLSDDEFIEAYQAARDGISCNYRPSKPEALANTVGYRATVFNMLHRAKQRARKKNMPFMLTPDDVFERVEMQGGVCALSGMSFDISPNPRRGHKRPFSMSIDRISHDQGYLPDNIRITTVIVNMARLNWSDEDFRKMCSAVAKKR